MLSSIKNFTTGTHRLNALLDGVFAIAITLLVLELKIPEHEPITTSAQLKNSLIDILPSVVSYLISFIVIGGYWSRHHMLEKFIVKCDRMSVKITMRFLLGISLLPFTTYLIGRYGNLELAVAIYALNVAACGWSLFTLWTYATDHKELMDPHTPQDFAQYYRSRLLVSPVLFLLSIPVCFYDPQWGRYMWLGVLLMGPLFEKFHAKKFAS